jgi:hypothetical protein
MPVSPRWTLALSSFMSLPADSPSRAARSAGHPRLRAVALSVALALAAPAATAISLGSPEVLSRLGQPLQLRVPVTHDDVPDLSAQCVRLVHLLDADIPSLNAGRIAMERATGGSHIVVTTGQPIDEPALRLMLEVGCLQRIRREFTLLLDPPTAHPAVPQAAQAPQAPQVPPARTAPLAAPVGIEFGPPQIMGTIGQPLLVNVPITGPGVASLAESCVRAARSDSGELPRVLNDARVALIDRDGGRALRVHTPEPVFDARVRFILDVGCERPVRREFVVALDEPRLPEVVAAPAPAAAPAEPPRRVAQAPAPPRPAVAVAPKLPRPAPPPEKPALPEPPQAAEPKPIEPARLPPREPSPSADRLVLTPPEEQPPAAGPTEREREVLKRVEALSAEIQKLRSELELATTRNRELTQKSSSSAYAWGAAVAAALLFGLGLMLGSRGRRRMAEEPRESPAGPMTRILGQSPEPRTSARTVPTPAPVPRTAAPAPREPAPETRPPDTDAHADSTAIMVTEFRDTTQVIGELYSSYVDRHPTTQQAGPPTQPSPQTKTEIALDLDLSKERTTVLSPQTVSPQTLSPQTKTEIAVDIDLFESNTQIGRDLQREYERLDLAAGGKPPADIPKPDEAKTIPMGPGKGLDLDLDLPSAAKDPKQPPKKSG